MGLKEIKLPDLGEGVTEGEITKIYISPGETVSMDQALLEVMTDKAAMEVPSSLEGTIKEVKIKEGDLVAVGQILFTLETSGRDSSPEVISASKKTTKLESKKTNSKSASSQQKNDSLAIPATRKLAKEFQVNLAGIPKSGDTITRQDLIKHIQSSRSSSSVKSSSRPLQIDPAEEVKRAAPKGIKRIMFETMSLSKATIPHFTITETANVRHLVNVRNQLKARLKSQNIHLTYLPFFIKAISSGLNEFPIFNSSYDEQAGELVYKKSSHIGFAVDTGQGLIVPVIKKVEQKSMLDITKELSQLGEQARDGSIKRENLMGASITLTNLGSIAGLSGTPIINPPEVSILGIYRMYKQVVKTKNGFEEQPFINFSLTCDHRLIDGATAARFLKNFIARMEEPSLLILD